MFKKRSSLLLIFWALLMPLPMVLNSWGCDGALLKNEVQQYYAKLSHGKPLDKKQILDSLNFLGDKTDYSGFNYENFTQVTEDFKGISALGYEPYHSFAKMCGEIYENGNERQKIAISILFKKVSEEYFSYGNCVSYRAQRGNLTNNSRKSTEYNYPSLIYTMQLVNLIEVFPSDIKLFIDSILMCLVEREYPRLKGELLRCLLLNGDPLHTKTVEKISEKAFYLITGIKRITFQKMIPILQEVFDLKKLRTGRQNKLSTENILLMAIEYFGGYGHHAGLSKSYGLDLCSAYRNVKSVEGIFAKDLKLNLPEIFDKKRNIADDLINKSIDDSIK